MVLTGWSSTTWKRDAAPRRWGCGVTGTLGVVRRAKAMGRIAQATPVIEHRSTTGLGVSDALVQHLLREIGE